MPDFHAEPYVYLAGLTHKAALIAWGGFYFRVRSRKNGDEWKLVDDSDLDHVRHAARQSAQKVSPSARHVSKSSTPQGTWSALPRQQRRITPGFLASHLTPNTLTAYLLTTKSGQRASGATGWLTPKAKV